jgi:hypothetical protein
MLVESRGWRAASAAVILIAIFSLPLVTRNLRRLFIGPGYDDSRLVTIDRETVHYNSYGAVPPMVIPVWKRATSFETMLTLERWTFADGTHAERVSPGVLELTGVHPWRGTLLPKGDADAAVIGFDMAQGDASWLGRSIQLGLRKFRVAGIMPPHFQVLSREAEVWIPLPTGAERLEVIGKLRPGATPGTAQAELRKLSLNARQARARKLEVITLRQNRQDDLVFAGSILMWNFGFVCLVAAVALVRFLRLPEQNIPLPVQLRYLGFLLAKSLVIFAGMALLWIVLIDPGLQQFLTDLAGWAVPILFWCFLLASWGMTGWILRDQQNRCRTCCERLRMPVHSGLWSSLVIDRPRTEYICPYGHGTLYVPGTRLLDIDSVNWTSNRDFWHELLDEGSVPTRTS